MLRKIIKYLVLSGLAKLYKNSDTVAGSSVHRILVVRLDEIGDMVLMSPFLRELRKNYLDAEITLVVKPAVYDLVELCPYVNHIKTFKRPSLGRGMYFRLLWVAKKFVREELDGSYDLALVPRFDADAGYGAGFIALFSKAVRRVGYASTAIKWKAVSDYGFDCLYTDFVPVRSGVVHEVERNLDMLRYLGCTIRNSDLELWTSREDEAAAERLLGRV